MGGGEGLSEAVDRVLDATTLGRELPGHLVEGAPEGGELVAAPNGDALPELASRDGAGGVGEFTKRAHDRPAKKPREDGDDRKGEEGEEEEALAEPGDCVIDRRRRRRDDEGERRIRLEDRRRHRPIARVADRDVLGLRQRRDARPDDVVRTREHLAVLDEQDSIRVREPGRGSELGEQRAIEGEPDDDAADQRTVLVEDRR